MLFAHYMGLLIVSELNKTGTAHAGIENYEKHTIPDRNCPFRNKYRGPANAAGNPPRNAARPNGYTPRANPHGS
jgi:hypothetical protein